MCRTQFECIAVAQVTAMLSTASRLRILQGFLFSLVFAWAVGFDQKLEFRHQSQGYSMPV